MLTFLDECRVPSKNKLTTSCLLRSLLLLMLVSPGSVLAATCNVPSVPYATIQNAVDTPACSLIQVATGSFPDPVNVTRNLEIRGSGHDNSQPFTSVKSPISILNGAILTLSNLAVEFSTTDGIILASVGAELIADNFRASNNTGDGIKFSPAGASSRINVSNCQINDNNRGILAIILTMDNCIVSLNNGQGGIQLSAIGGGQIDNSVVTFNEPRGIFIDDGLLTVTNSNIEDNGSDLPGITDGGGILLQKGSLNISGSVVKRNTAGRRGGGISSNDFFSSSLTITDTTIADNVAYSAGGGIALAKTTNISNSTIRNNSAIHDNTVNINGIAAGGGIYAFGGGSVTITDSSIKNNSVFTASGSISVNSGGGLYAATVTGPTLSVKLERVTVSGNYAEKDGGAIFAITDLKVDNSTIAQNRADRNGGGISSDSAVAFLNNVTVSENIADDDANGDGNGGGLSGQSQLYFTAVGGNIDRSGSPNYRPDCSGSVSALGYSAIGIVNGCSASWEPGNPATSGNMNGTTPAPLDLKLLPLADNGGPVVLPVGGIRVMYTVAPGIGSPVLDAGTPGCGVLPTDQRGQTRIGQDGNNDGGGDGDPCDLGALETFKAGCDRIPIVVTEFNYTGRQDVLSEISISTSGNVTVSTGDVSFTATSGVTLMPGFNVEPGGTFLAETISVNCP